ncbi:MAG: nucleoside 2-deoxyribosyltransferase [Candidatus Hodarchaeota archaeon]
MKTFLICPVRGHDPSETFDVVSKLEIGGWDVHWPPRDTDQEDDVGLNICKENRQAIEDADVVHFVWDGKSTGCLFDLGIAFALKKPIIPISMPKLTSHKSFQNMVNAWAGQED